LIAQVEDAKQKGARVHCGGEVVTTQGYFYPATVLSDITPQMRVWHEEVFGPVACLFRFEHDDEALKLANESDFGLGATVFTRDTMRQERFKQDLACGMVFVNEMVRSDPRFPFGGIKESGFGRELGDRASLAFTNEKTIWINRA
jgi:succinate-semialdehyde dehydrogenase/glutarate-semialdehyde dehydrogenase